LEDLTDSRHGDLESHDPNTERWDTVISPDTPWFQLQLRELWRYRDLIGLLVRRDFVAEYKQTILGPLWLFLKPLMTAAVLTVIFGRIAKMPTEGSPDFLFFLSGTVCWNFFSRCLTHSSETFITGAHIFKKVYFPRLVAPISAMISSGWRFIIQVGLFLGFLVYYLLKGCSVSPTVWVLLVPLLVLQMGLLGLGCGLLVSSLTTKYRDLGLFVEFGVQLWMFATPVIYPLSSIPMSYATYLAWNPMTAVVEVFRLAFVGTSSIQANQVYLSLSITFALLVSGIILFTRVERTIADTV
jgi:lipopolysaccharide transport system permease protein